jgi:hypothetical protein
LGATSGADVPGNRRNDVSGFTAAITAPIHPKPESAVAGLRRPPGGRAFDQGRDRPKALSRQALHDPDTLKYKISHAI